MMILIFVSLSGPARQHTVYDFIGQMDPPMSGEQMIGRRMLTRCAFSLLGGTPRQ